MSIIYRSLNEATGEWATVELPNFDLPRSARFSGPIAERVAALDAAETTVADQLRAFRDRAGSAATSGGTAGIEAANDNMTALRAIRSERDELNAAVAGIDSIEATRRAAAHPAGMSLFGGQDGDAAFDVEPRSLRPGGELRDAARRAAEALHTTARLTDAAAERAEALLTPREDEPQSRSAENAARWLLATGAPSYRSAFFKLLGGGQAALATLSDRERAAFAAAEYESRALALSGDFGSLVPADLDPSLILTSPASPNAVRRRAAIVTTASDEYVPFVTAGVSATWRAEAAETSESTPTATPKPIKPKRYDVFIPFSFEVSEDVRSFADELRRVMLNSVETLHGDAFTNGTGLTVYPQGLLTGLVADSRTVPSDAAGVIDADDVRSLLAAVPPAFRPNATWMADLAIINMIAGLETANGAKEFPGLDEGVLMRRAADENSYMPATIAATPATTSALICGDIREAYTIVDRVGSRVELVPHLFGANGRPTGERGFFLYGRVGAGVVNSNAARVLRVAGV